MRGTPVWEGTVNPSMPQSPGDETIYGYPIRDLVVFAECCRVAGVEPKDLTDFIGDIQAACEVIQKAVDEEFVRCIKKCMRSIQIPGDGANMRGEEDGCP